LRGGPIDIWVPIPVERGGEWCEATGERWSPPDLLAELELEIEIPLQEIVRVPNLRWWVIPCLKREVLGWVGWEGN
jgi:hypothetical protein